MKIVDTIVSTQYSKDPDDPNSLLETQVINRVRSIPIGDIKAQLALSQNKVDLYTERSDQASQLGVIGADPVNP